MKADYDSSANLHKHEFSTSYGKELAPVLRDMREAQKKVDDNKKLLADTDYVVAKYTEGLIDETSWTKSQNQRSSWRTLVNEGEESLAKAKVRYESLKSQHKASQTREERFNEAVARDNACLQLLKDFYNPPLKK